MKTHIFYLTRQQHKLLENRWKIQRYGDFDCGQTSCLDRQTCVRRLPRINMAAALMYRSNEQQQTMWYLHVPIGGTVGSYLYLPLLPHASLQTLRLYFNRTQHVSISLFIQILQVKWIHLVALPSRCRDPSVFTSTF